MWPDASHVRVLRELHALPADAAFDRADGHVSPRPSLSSRASRVCLLLALLASCGGTVSNASLSAPGDASSNADASAGAEVPACCVLADFPTQATTVLPDSDCDCPADGGPAPVGSWCGSRPYTLRGCPPTAIDSQSIWWNAQCSYSIEQQSAVDGLIGPCADAGTPQL